MQSVLAQMNFMYARWPYGNLQPKLGAHKGVPVP